MALLVDIGTAAVTVAAECAACPAELTADSAPHTPGEGPCGVERVTVVGRWRW